VVEIIMADPEDAELPTLNTMQKIADWCTMSAALVKGMSEATGIIDMAGHPRNMGVVSRADFLAVIASVTVGEDARPPTLVEKAQMTTFHRVSCLVSKTEKTKSELAADEVEAHNRAIAIATAHGKGGTSLIGAHAAPPSVSSSPLKKVKMNVLDQQNESEIACLTGTELEAKFRRWHMANGGDANSTILIMPLKEEEPSSEQITAMEASLKNGSAWADFASFQPFSDRIRRRDVFKALLFNAKGELVPTEIKGPSTFEQWAACWTVYKVCLVMCGGACIPALDAYHALIKKLYVKYGSVCWGLLYQTDHRARLEEIERIRRKASIIHAASAAAGITPVVTDPYPYHPDKPWDYCFHTLATTSDYWKEEFTDNALLIMSRATVPAAYIDGDAPMEGTGSSSSMGVGRGTNPPPPQRRGDPPPRRETTAKKKTEAKHMVDNGVCTHNRSGNLLCKAFNEGNCVATGGGKGSKKGKKGTGPLACPNNSWAVHQCNKCLSSTHNATSSECRGSTADRPRPGRAGKK